MRPSASLPSSIPRPRRTTRPGRRRRPASRDAASAAASSAPMTRMSLVSATEVLLSGSGKIDDLPDGPVSTELDAWLARDEPKTIGNLIELFGPKSFALLFVLLLGLPALPLPT